MSFLDKLLVRNLDMEYTTDVEFLGKYLHSSNRIHYLTGESKVGKTTFCLKLIRQIILDSHYKAKILFIQFDERARYLTHRITHSFEAIKPGIFDNVKFLWPGNIKLIIKNPIDQTFRQIINSTNWDYVFIDGTDFETGKIDFLTRWRFKKTILRYQKEKQIPFIVTIRKKKPAFTHKINFNFRKNRIVRLHLERPAFFGEEIKFFGDTWLFITPGINH